MVSALSLGRWRAMWDDAVSCLLSSWLRFVPSAFTLALSSAFTLTYSRYVSGANQSFNSNESEPFEDYNGSWYPKDRMDNFLHDTELNEFRLRHYKYVQLDKKWLIQSL